MNELLFRQKIDDMVTEIVDSLVSQLGSYIESITLTGSYAIGRISLERPNINILVFAKPHPPANLYLETGRILYKIGRDFLDYFSFRVEPFPFRFARPIGNKEVEVAVNLNIFEVTAKDLVVWITPHKKMWTPFGATELLMQVFRAMRKVVYGTDILGEMEFQVSHENILMDVIREFPTFKLQLTRAPMTYDIDKDYELLATEALEIGKACIGRTAEVLLDDASIKLGKHIELIGNKQDLLIFLRQTGSPDLAKWGEIIITARDNFLVIKKDKQKVLELYDAAYNILNVTFEMAIDKFYNFDRS